MVIRCRIDCKIFLAAHDEGEEMSLHDALGGLGVVLDGQAEGGHAVDVGHSDVGTTGRREGVEKKRRSRVEEREST